jgi:hypothetical protein
MASLKPLSKPSKLLTFIIRTLEPLVEHWSLVRDIILAEFGSFSWKYFSKVPDKYLHSV